jgi:hypothetical protein
MDFPGMAGLSLRCCVWASEGVPACPPVHRQDEPARLSLGVVASQQSQLLFHLEADCNSVVRVNCGKSLHPS